MSVGIFFVGLVIGAAIFFFGIGLCCQNEDWNVQGFVTMFAGICFFALLWILALSFPNGFEEIKESIRGNEVVHLRMQISDKQEMTSNDKAIVDELKKLGFVISSIEDDFCTDGRGNVRTYYRAMSLIGPKREKTSNSVSSKYETLNCKSEEQN